MTNKKSVSFQQQQQQQQQQQHWNIVSSVKTELRHRIFFVIVECQEKSNTLDREVEKKVKE